MKKAVLLTICGVLLLAAKSEAQVFITSFGVNHSWGVPADVYYTVDHHYHEYNWVHARRIVDHGSISFEVILQSGGVFVSVHMDAMGRIYRSVVNYHYPLDQHVCNDFCGYHTSYYNRYMTVCNSHHHHGHNHVVYVDTYHAPHGHAYGYYKSDDHHQNQDQSSRSSAQPTRVVYQDRPESVTHTSSSGKSKSSHRSTVAVSDSRSRTSANVGSTNQSRSRSASEATYRSRRD